MKWSKSLATARPAISVMPESADDNTIGLFDFAAIGEVEGQA